MRIGAAAVTIAAVFALVLASQARPTPGDASGLIIVETTDDEQQFDGICSIRHALGNASVNGQPFTDCEAGTPGLDVIMLPAGTIALQAFAGQLVPTDDVTFVGDAGGTSTFDGGDAIRILEIPDDVTVTIDTLTLSNGYNAAISGGGAIDNNGNLIIRNSVLEENYSDSGHGGAINSTGDTTLHIEDSVLRRNGAAISGGAIAAGGGPCGTVTLLRVTIESNSAWTYGGGINSCGTLTIDESVIRNNDIEWAGGGIENIGDAVIRDSVISGNTVEGDMEQNGGGIRNASLGALTVERSLITGNTADHGGGISNAGEATITNTTLTDNFALNGSGFSSGDNNAGGPQHASLTNVTIAGDPPGVASAQGVVIVADSGIGGPSGTVELTNTILAADDDSNCVGGVTIVSNGHNISGDDTCSLNAAGDQESTGALIGPLTDNGGPTRTHALLPGSPALGAADGTACPDDDQRGEPRPQGDGCDVGAFESDLTTPTPTPSPSPSPTPPSSPTPSPTPATPSPSPSPTSPPGGEHLWGDHNCSDTVDSVDALLTLRFDAGLPAETGECPELGEEVEVQNASLDMHIWGDLDCSGLANSVDALKVLRHDAGLSVERPPSCPDPGETVSIA